MDIEASAGLEHKHTGAIAVGQSQQHVYLGTRLSLGPTPFLRHKDTHKTEQRSSATTTVTDPMAERMK